ncbi:hypothetical protein [Leptospira borgpetersenii]|uniref:Uncharacterized protein n=1 Tax=Leptospira borgpetersenii str. Brem 328 TaxID=1049780 RepID=A0ABC9SD80_LEPBO|nr:hypothetical protein [Leptospira borgpetersenii]EMN15659.1 hypothetical protein LEP1GSC056_4024 [Leptospira borgpetersenii str. Brem 328]
MQSFPMGRSAGARLFHGGLSEKIEVIVGIKKRHASSSESEVFKLRAGLKTACTQKA